MKRKKLTDEQKLFCLFVSQGYSPREAAAKAGYSDTSGAEGLMLKKEIKKFTESLQRTPDDMYRAACAGYIRSACPPTNDAVKLLVYLTGQTPSDIPDMERLDLSAVSEIKLQKGGVAEIKFFDRTRALDALVALCERQSKNDAIPLYKALAQGAQMLSDSRKDFDES